MKIIAILSAFPSSIQPEKKFHLTIMVFSQHSIWDILTDKALFRDLEILHAKIEKTAIAIVKTYNKFHIETDQDADEEMVDQGIKAGNFDGDNAGDLEVKNGCCVLNEPSCIQQQSCDFPKEILQEGEELISDEDMFDLPEIIGRPAKIDLEKLYDY